MYNIHDTKLKIYIQYLVLNIIYRNKDEYEKYDWINSKLITKLPVINWLLLDWYVYKSSVI